MEPKDYVNRDDEVIIVALPREQVEVLKQVIKREQAYSWFISTIKSWWVWIVAGGVLTFITLYDKLGIFGAKING